MPSRRAFLQSLGLLAAPLAAGALNAARLPGPAPSGSPHFQGPYGLQLYSLRNQIPADPGLWFKRIRTIGYTHVEAAGLYNMTPQVFRQHLDQAGLKCDGMHEPYPALDKNFSQIVDTAHTLGVEYVICSWVDEPLRPNLDGWRRVADTFIVPLAAGGEGGIGPEPAPQYRGIIGIVRSDTKTTRPVLGERSLSAYPAAVTGRLHGPELDRIFALLGPVSLLRRVEKALALS